MRFVKSSLLALGLVLSACASTPSRLPATTPLSSAPKITIPIEYYRLSNGLRVVLSHDVTAPTTTIGVYYHIGFRIEPKDRTGFAHLFEHLMFQETSNLSKGDADKIINGNGGVSNGSTRFDYTNYFQVVPSHVTESVLWVEADRMKGLVLSESSLQNQKDVVKNEVRVNVINRPYGGFPWLDLPQLANSNWYNAHNFYGALADIDAASLKDVREFYDSYYVPANAVLVVAGDFDQTTIRAAIERQFAALPTRSEPTHPDVTEPKQAARKISRKTDPLAPRPALAIGYHLPPRNTPEWYAFGLIDQLLLQGEDSRLWQKLVKEKGYSDSLDGGINLLGNMFSYEGPMLWSAYLIHDSTVTDARISADFDAVTQRLKDELVSATELARAVTKIRSSLYDIAGSPTRFGLVEILASLALFDDDPSRFNEIETRFREVTPELVRQTARQYLTPNNQTILSLDAGHTQAEHTK